MYWNGYSGTVTGSGGRLGCDGAMRLHGPHVKRASFIAAVMPGQNTDDFALDIIP